MIAAALISLISLVIGAVIGLILAGLRNPPAAGASDRKHQNELARLVRNSRSGQLGVEINGKLYSTSRQLNTAQRTALAQVHDELQLWLGVEDLPGRVSSFPAKEPIAPTARVAPLGAGAVVPAPLPATSARPDAAPVIPQKPLRSEPASNVRPPSLEIGEILARAINPVEPVRDAPDAPTTLAGQVDAIIQERLPQSALSDRSIKLKDGPDGGIVVLVDGQKYRGVGEVTDAQVRTFIQACVAEWEKKYGK
jgi:hypothetical protein